MKTRNERNARIEEEISKLDRDVKSTLSLNRKEAKAEIVNEVFKLRRHLGYPPLPNINLRQPNEDCNKIKQDNAASKTEVYNIGIQGLDVKQVKQNTCLTQIIQLHTQNAAYTKYCRFIATWKFRERWFSGKAILRKMLILIEVRNSIT